MLKTKEVIPQERLGTSQLFTKLAIGDYFHVGISYGIGYHSNVASWIVYKKTSKSIAVCVEQHGYRNQRQFGKDKSFSANSGVYKLDSFTKINGDYDNDNIE